MKFWLSSTFILALLVGCNPTGGDHPNPSDTDDTPTAGDPRAGGDEHPAGDSRGGDAPVAGDDAQPGDSPTPGDDANGDSASTDPSLLPAHILAFAPTYVGRAADGDDIWVDIQINDASALGSDWRLMAATYSYVTEQMRAEQLPWTLTDGDILRYHGIDYINPSDTTLGDNNADRWDFRSTATFGVNIKHGVLWIEDSAGDVVDLVLYETHLNQGDWLSGDAITFFDAAIVTGHWPGNLPSDAVYIDNAEIEFALLVDSTVEGQSASDWRLVGGTVADYYELALGQTGDALKYALNTIIKSHTVVPYDDADDAFYATDADPAIDGNVIQFYTGHSTTSDFNREHIWAKSHGGFDADSQAGYSDLHHLRPTRTDVNSARWHLDFDNGGELFSDSGARRVQDLSWEPRDAVKGDVARMCFYMAVRYEGGDSNMPDLELVEVIPSLLDATGTPNNNQHVNTPRHGRLSTLLAWHLLDPPDDAERNRNQIIYEQFQGNRNPFIDHPEWVYEIWGGPVWPGP